MENLYIFNKKAFDNFTPSHMLNAYILKWIYQGNIEVVEGEKEFWGLGKTKQALNILSKPQDMGKLEEDFFEKVEYSLAYSDDGYMTEKSFARYVDNHRSSMARLVNSFGERSIMALEKEGYILRQVKKFLFSKREDLSPTDKGIKLYKNLICFKNYLEDYSLIRERDIDEAKLWD